MKFLEMVTRARKKGMVFLSGRVIIFCFVLPVVILIRLLRPLVQIRFSVIHSERIGHFAMNTELYLCKRDMAKQENKRSVDVFCFNDYIVNQQLALMWGRQLRIWPIAKFIDKVNRLIPGGKYHVISENETDVDPEGLLAQLKPHLFFTVDEEKSGQKALSEMGIGKEDSWVCFHCRSPQYCATMYPSLDFSYHNYRDADVNSYHLAIKNLSQKGYFLVHMGKYAQRPLDITCDKVIDYACSPMRSDFLDIYLSAKCKFFISTGGGINAVPRIFRRPVVFLNLAPFEYSPSSSPDNLLIFKKYWIKSERRLMTFPEIIKSGAGRYLYTAQYEKNGLELIDNTAEEIKAAVIEMEGRISGTWETTDDDDVLQRRFWALFNGSELHGVKTSRVSAVFLRENRALLEMPGNMDFSVQLRTKG
jgi:putative glycosyltransferase (TIGR04372 family)